MIGRYRATPYKRFPAASVWASTPVGNAVPPMPKSPPVAPMDAVPAPSAACEMYQSSTQDFGFLPRASAARCVSILGCS
jgi:hypothetical protein